jgi:hypothetical protein
MRVLPYYRSGETGSPPEAGVAVDRDLKSGKLDIVIMTPREMVDLARELLSNAYVVERRTEMEERRQDQIASR